MTKKKSKKIEDNFITRALFKEELEKKDVAEAPKLIEPSKPKVESMTIRNRIKRKIFKFRTNFKAKRERTFKYINDKIFSKIRFSFIFKVFLEVNLYGILGWLAVRNLHLAGKIFIYINYTYVNMLGYGSLIYLLLEIVERIISAVRTK